MHKIVNWELRCIVEQLCGFIGIESYKEWFLLKYQTSFFLMLWKWMEVLPSNERYTENSHFTKMALDMTGPILMDTKDAQWLQKQKNFLYYPDLNAS